MQQYKLTLVLISLALIVLIDLYSWQALKTLLRNRSARIISLAKQIHFGIGFIVIAMLLSSFIFIALEKNQTYRVYFQSSVFIIYISKLFACLLLLGDDIRRGILWLKKRMHQTKKKHHAPHNQPVSQGITRAQFLSQAGTITSGIPLILLSKGIFKGAYDYRIHRVPLSLPNAPAAFKGLKIVQLSDIHTGSLLNEDAVKRGVDMAMAEKPDVIFFTGDLVNVETTEAYRYADMFRDLKAPMGTFSIFGNHDYGDYIQWESKEAKQKNLDDLAKLHGDMGWHLMRNEHVTLDKNGQRIALIGVENWGSHGRFQRIGDIEKATKNIPDVPVKLLLSHDPSHFDSIISNFHQDIDVTFSGHTHGFQFGFEWGKYRWSPSQYIYPHWAGMYEVGRSRLYVNRGFGFLGYPGRVGIMPEITVFEIV